ncbi:sigma-54-dependent Fis family transcriptional regulator [Terriglobus tenax]|uniref:sigma-54-dependent Fis family transcriptional regulator n=1 Tax=Terriglobus tenax TaxID=1111115 RepID=UPI0021E0835C|nr:helix-turn-helix domain-containing protein [Terriglobus tenax]
MQQANSISLRHPLPEIIQASWHRCRHYGMSPHWHVNQNPLTDSELHLQQDRHHQLRRLALREMRILEHTLASTGRILLLADSTGIILDSQGDNAFLGRARRVSLMPGANWREQITGTNAIGTAIVERRFVQVLGQQHFFDENRFLACNAMPIMAPTGHLAGVLDISNHACESIHSPGRLVRHAVAHIEHDWVAEIATDLLVRFHPHPSWLNTPEEGILTFEDGLLTGASTRALAYLGLSPASIHALHWSEIFQHRPMYGQQELRPYHTPGIFYADVGKACTASARIAATETAHTGPENLEDLKDEALRRAVEAENGNISAAARKLGIHRSTFYRRLNRTS